MRETERERDSEREREPERVRDEKLFSFNIQKIMERFSNNFNREPWKYRRKGEEVIQRETGREEK